MGEPQTPHLYNLGIFGRVPGSQNHLFSFLETQGHLKNIKKNLGSFKTIIFESQMFGNRQFRKFPKRRAPKDPDDASDDNVILKFLDTGSISIKKHGIEICHMDQISFKNIRGFLNL